MNKCGMTLVEVMVASALLVAAVFVLLQLISNTSCSQYEISTSISAMCEIEKVAEAIMVYKNTNAACKIYIYDSYEYIHHDWSGDEHEKLFIMWQNENTPMAKAIITKRFCSPMHNFVREDLTLLRYWATE